MGTLRSKFDWSGREVNGIVLGIATFDEQSQDYIWDGDVINGIVDSVGVITPIDEIANLEGTLEKVGDLVAPEIMPESPPISQEEKDLGVKSLTIKDGEVIGLDSKNKEIILSNNIE